MLRRKFHSKVPLFLLGLCLGIVLSILGIPPLYSNISCSKYHVFNENLHGFLRELRSDSSEVKESSLSKSPLNIEANIESIGSKNEQPKLVRPRYYSSELGMRERLFVAVISDKENIVSFGPAINRTLSKYVNKLVFFLDDTRNAKLNLNLPLVGFKSKNKSHKMLRIFSYIIENFLNSYNYFYFVTDHTYVNGNQLNRLLNSASLEMRLHLGKVLGNSSSCLVDQGILISRSMMELMKSNWKQCLEHSALSVIEESFAMCVSLTSGASCTSSVKWDKYKSLSYALYETGGETKMNFQIASVAHISDPQKFYVIHRQILQEIVRSKTKEILSTQAILGETRFVEAQWPSGSFTSSRPPTRHDVLIWEYFNQTHLSKMTSKSRQMELKNVIENSVLYADSKVDVKSFNGIQYGYSRFDPTRGTDYQLALNFTLNDGRFLVKRLEAFRSLGLPEVIPIPYVTEATHVVFLLFVEKGSVLDWIDFIKRIEKNVEIEQITLYFTLLQHLSEQEDDPYKNLKEHISSFTAKYYNRQSRATWKSFIYDRTPSRLELIDNAIKGIDSTSLTFTTQPKAFIDTTLLNKIKLNVVKGWQIFSLIPFTSYHPKILADPQKISIASVNGWFDAYNYDNIGFYASDYLMARKTFIREKNDLHDDVDLIQLFSQYTQLHILRSPDSTFVLPFHEINCPKSDKLCFNRKSQSLGSSAQLSQIVVNYKKSHS